MSLDTKQFLEVLMKYLGQDDPYNIYFHTRLTASPEKPDNVVDLSKVLSAEEIQAVDRGFKQYGKDYIGQISYKNFSDGLYSKTFFPFSGKPMEFRYSPFLGKGVADQIQYIIARMLQEKFGSDRKVIHQYGNKWRKPQLNRLGIEIGVWYTLGEYVRIIGDNLQPFPKS